MHINKIYIQNFRLLQNVALFLEKQTTVIVGRNNSGKTSLTELFRCLLQKDSPPRFRLEDFSIGVHNQFWEAFELKQAGKEEDLIRKALPVIKVELTVEYKDDGTNIGPLGNFIIDLNPACTIAQVNILYALEDGKIQDLFDDIEPDKTVFFKAMKERIPKYFKASLQVQDPGDPTNQKALEFPSLRAILQFGFVNAQRALDDTTQTDRGVLSDILEALFTAATSATANPDDQNTAEELKEAVVKIQEGIDTDFNKQLKKLLPTFELFGYPGLSDPNLRTETILKVEQLLSKHTTVGYECANGINLPESYNGLGPRNLIFILLKLFEFFRSYTIKQPASGVHLIFIEEPEAHLHPQMQNVFIRQLGGLAKLLGDQFNNGNPWPVQFVVTTHSSHIANEANFDSMRYFLAQPQQDLPGLLTTEVKDLRIGLSGELEENREFLHKYMTITRCDLLFADRAILIEGASERLMLPKIIEKFDAGQPAGEKLASQYLSIMEVGGAYAQVFFNLLDFLNLRALIITDLDTVNQDGHKCKVSEGIRSSNSCINDWFKVEQTLPTKDELLVKNEDSKLKKNRRLAFQIPHSAGDACGRSFEDAFMLANPTVFNITGSVQELENQVWEAAKHTDKTDFALEYAIKKTAWVVPRYIEEGLKWLAKKPVENPAVEATQAIQPLVEEGSHVGN